MTSPNTIQSLLTILGARQGTTPVDRKGDVLLECKHTTIRVSSEVLIRRSPYFGVLWGPNFSEGQAPRSAENPQRMDLPEDDSVGMVLLCYYLHYGFGKVQPRIFGYDENVMSICERLAQLAIVADKYQAVDYLKNNDVAQLFEPFRKVGRRIALTFEQMADLAVAAYIFAQDELFSLFTRCLILDYCDSLSSLVPSRFSEFIEGFPMLFLEDQRKALRRRVDQAVVRDGGTMTCKICGVTKHDPRFSCVVASNLTARGARLEQWLPDYLGYSLRTQMCALYSMGSFTGFNGSIKDLCPFHWQEPRHSRQHYEAAAELLNKQAAGICYTCTKEGNHAMDCEHEMALKQRISNMDTLAGHVDINNRR
ncbi:hypothetical protein Q7P37_003128 [Cladosporium fusiforme]